MDDTNPQRAPRSGMTLLRHGDRFWEIPDPVWEIWVRRGLVPPDALVLSALWTRGVWRRADGLEVYHLYRPPTPEEQAEMDAVSGSGPNAGTGALIPASPAGSGAGDAGSVRRGWRGLPVAIWGPGFSATQALVLANLLVSGILVWAWRDGYHDQLWALSGRLRAGLIDGWLPALFVPLFLHADAGHLLGNMVGLLAGGAAVEEFYGRGRTLALYLLAGICGATLSLARLRDYFPDGGDVSVPVLTVGASGAVMGLYGIIGVFLLRYRRRFSERQRRKTARIYLPLLMIALLPSIFGHDLLSHVGGFLGGIVGALLVRPDPTRMAWVSAAPGASGHPESSAPSEPPGPPGSPPAGPPASTVGGGPP
jgi:membrane associated rhomboid family serine protease